MQTYFTISILLIASLWPLYSLASQPVAPPLMLAKHYVKGIDVSKYFISEKLDGVRAYWDGQALYTRSGYLIPAPAWFLSALPSNKLDGELWLGRGRFDEISGLIRRKHARDKDWTQVKYMVYDLPEMVAPFNERYWVLKTLVAEQRKPWFKAVDHKKGTTEQQLQEQLMQVTAGGGEGLMLRHGRSLYQVERSNDLLKLKLARDDEAIVVGHIPGEGKFRGMLGALLVEDKRGRQFRLGTGFSDAQRRNPPQLGSQVSFSYNGETKSGLPRFARFLRQRLPE